MGAPSIEDPGEVAPTLVVMAGGLGSRFGGDKQLVVIGPNGEAFLDYAIRDAMEAGVGKVVVVARTDLDEPLREHLAAQHPAGLPLVIVHQDTFGPRRSKPWGTGHAVLSAAAEADGPIVVINADDHYGRSGIRRALEGMAGGSERAVLVAFRLDRTLPVGGAVSRGVCEVDGNELLCLVETHGIRREGVVILADDPPGELSADAPVSMNLWVLPRKALVSLGDQWEVFHDAYADDPSAEFLLPVAIDEQRAAGLLGIDVVRSDERWIGVTNRDDLAVARAAFADG